LSEESAETAYRQYDDHSKERTKIVMFQLAQEPAGNAAVRDLVTLAYNPTHTLNVRNEFRLARAGLIDVTSKPDHMVYYPNDIRAALTFVDDDVFLEEIQLGTKQRLKIDGSAMPAIGSRTQNTSLREHTEGSGKGR